MPQCEIISLTPGIFLGSVMAVVGQARRGPFKTAGGFANRLA